MSHLSNGTVKTALGDSEIWANLRAAISNTPAFQGWKQEQEDVAFPDLSLDKQVRLYLRETLATLAY